MRVGNLSFRSHLSSPRRPFLSSIFLLIYLLFIYTDLTYKYIYIYIFVIFCFFLFCLSTQDPSILFFFFFLLPFLVFIFSAPSLAGGREVEVRAWSGLTCRPLLYSNSPNSPIKFEENRASSPPFSQLYLLLLS